MNSGPQSCRVSNLEFSLGGLVREGRPSRDREATLCWMVNVVRQEGRGEAMTALARRCMDRFLASLDEEESILAWSCSPLLAASCLLVTSKIFSPNPLTARSLLKYSDNAFMMQELLDCELLLLSRLGWDVYLDLEEEDAEDQTSARIQLDNLNFSETSR